MAAVQVIAAPKQRRRLVEQRRLQRAQIFRHAVDLLVDVRICQEIGLIQSAGHHTGHHRSPSDRRYCPLTNWINPVLDGLGVWHAIERGLRAIGISVEVEA